MNLKVILEPSDEGGFTAIKKTEVTCTDYMCQSKVIKQ